MDDTIYRQAALDAMGERPLTWTGGDYELGCRNQYDTDRLAIETVPSAQPGWIPVTEQCPEIGQIVLCSLKTRHYYGRIHVCKYRAADKYYDHSYFDWDHNGFPDVVAWMPLPKPWEGEKL